MKLVVLDPHDQKRIIRCPDVVGFLPGNPAQDRKTHYLGGPDFAVEIVSRYDRSRKKFKFYRSVGVRELLFVDRSPWGLELFRNTNGRSELVGKSVLAEPTVIPSAVLPVTFQLTPDNARPRIVVARTDGLSRSLA